MSTIWSKSKNMHWIFKVLIVLALLFALANIGLATGTDSDSGSIGIPDAGAATATVTDPNTLAQIPAADYTPERAAADLDAAVDDLSIVLDPGQLLAPPLDFTQPNIIRYSPGCHGRVWRRHTVKQPKTGFVYGWRQTSVSQWCNNDAGVLTTAGTASGNDGSYSNFAWCFQDVDYGRAWWNVSHTEAKAWNRGTLKVCAKVVPATKVFNPTIFVHGPTPTRRYRYWNYGTGTPNLH